MDKLVALQVFRRVVELESFSRAAEDLHLSNAAISKNVRELEQALKTQLIQRTTRRLSLTETGQLYFQKVCAILDELATVEETVSDLSVKPHGLLRVTAPMSLGLTHVATAIYQFQLAYPDIQIELTLSDRYVDLIEEGFDVGIRGGGASLDTSLAMHHICEFPRVVCASPTYLQQHGEPQSPDELEQHQCVIYSLARSPHEWSFWQENKTAVVNVSGPLKVNNSLAASQAAITGLGIICLPVFVASEALKRKELKIILREWSIEPLTLYAICLKHRQRARKLQVFIDFIANALTSISDQL
ncbi:MAG: LysR family transcriptional regulator [Cyanobacteria bacterium P01_D01_bin.105]